MTTSIVLALKIVVGLVLLVIGVEFIRSLIIYILSAVVGLSLAALIINKITFFGTIVHELSHALMAVLTGAKVKGINLFYLIPRSDALGTTYVVFSKNALLQSIQRVFVAIAPIIGGITVIYLLNTLPLDKKWMLYLIRYLQISVLLHLSISKTDMRVGVSGLPIVFILIVLIIAILIKFGLIT